MDCFTSNDHWILQSNSCSGNFFLDFFWKKHTTTLNHSPTDLFSRMHCPIDCAANVFYSRTALFVIRRCIAKYAIFPLSKSQVSPHFSLSCLLFTCFLASLHVCCLPTVAMYFNAKMFKVRCQLKLLVQLQTLLSSNCLSVNQLSVYNSFFFFISF